MLIQYFFITNHPKCERVKTFFKAEVSQKKQRHIVISDHHAQFLITPKILENNPNKVTLRRSYENFNNELFKNDLLKTDWESLLKTSLNDVNFSFEQFLLKLNNLVDIHAPFKYSKRKNEKHSKPWITNGIANSILCRAKDPRRKEELHKLYK